MKDEELVEMFCNGDESAITRLSEIYGRWIYNRCLRITGSHEDAEECYNDCLYKLWIWIPRSKPYKLKVYIYKVATNISIGLIAKKKVTKRGGFIVCTFEDMDFFSSFWDNTEYFVETYCIRKVFNDFLNDVSREKTEIFVERYFLQRKIEEISRKHNISKSKTKMILMRLRGILRKYLTQEDIYF